MDFTDKAVLVTGGSRGIGRTIAQQFAQKGARVGIHYNTNKKAAQDTLASLTDGRHIIVQADLMDSRAVEKMVSSAVDEMGRIDVLVNNAGVYGLHPIPEVSYDEWQEAWNNTVGTNLLGAANVSFLVARHMIEKGGGKIVNVSSRGAFRGEPRRRRKGPSRGAWMR